MKSSLTYNQRVIFSITYLVVVGVVLFDTQYRPPILRYPFQLFLRPWQSLEVKVQSVASFPSTFVRTVLSSQKMIADLQIKNAELQVQVGEAENAKKENEVLKKEIEKRDQANNELFGKVVITRIISIGSLTYLDKGLSDGVGVGGLVMSQEVLLGRIQKSDQFVSQAATFSQGSWQTVAQTQAGVKGVIVGKNNRVLFTQISADEKLDIGDQIFTSGSVADTVPPGLYVGQIQEKLENVGAPVQTVVVNQSVNIDSLPLVTIKMRE